MTVILSRATRTRWLKQVNIRPEMLGINVSPTLSALLCSFMWQREISCWAENLTSSGLGRNMLISNQNLKSRGQADQPCITLTVQSSTSSLLLITRRQALYMTDEFLVEHPYMQSETRSNANLPSLCHNCNKNPTTLPTNHVHCAMGSAGVSEPL